MSSKTTLIRVFRVELRGTKQNRSGSGQKKGFWEAPSCMSDKFKNTRAYKTILLNNLSNSGKMVDRILKDPDSEMGPLGVYDTNTQTIYINISKHIKGVYDKICRHVGT